MDSPAHDQVITAMRGKRTPPANAHFAMRDKAAALVWSAWMRTNRDRDPVVRRAIEEWAYLPGALDPEETEWVNRLARGEPVEVTVIRVGLRLWPVFSAGG